MLSIAQAQVYRYVDKNGDVHFTDKPPNQNKVESEVVTIKKQKAISGIRLPTVAKLEPIKNSNNGSTKTVLLEQLEFEYNGDNKAIGKAYKYTSAASNRASQLRQNDKSPAYPFPCLRDRNLTLSNAKYIFGKVDFIEPFNQAFEENGYEVAGKKTFCHGPKHG